MIVTAAGLGNLPGVIAAGLGIGAAEQYGSHIFGIGYQQAIAVLLLLIVLLSTSCAPAPHSGRSAVGAGHER